MITSYHLMPRVVTKVQLFTTLSLRDGQKMRSWFHQFLLISMFLDQGSMRLLVIQVVPPRTLISTTLRLETLDQRLEKANG